LIPEAERYLEKARQALNEARAIAGIELAEAAGRAAYLAAFHAAQALIFERSGKVPKTHRGVHAQFSRLAKNEPRISELPRFLSQAYDFKAVAVTRLGRPCRFRKRYRLSRRLKASSSCSNDRTRSRGSKDARPDDPVQARRGVARL
jgi:uncharacterized protein (UPF0332 family)